MENDLNNNIFKENKIDNNINIIEQVEKYLRYWKWFLLSCIITLLIAYVKLSFSRPTYKATATIKIDNEKNKGNSKLSAFQDMSMMGIMGGGQNHIEDEIEVLKSKSIISEVVKTLRLNVSFFTEKAGLSNLLDNSLGLDSEFYKLENYSTPPLKINFISNDSIIYNSSDSFIITPKSVNSFVFKNLEIDNEKKYSFGEKVMTKLGYIIVTPSSNSEIKNFINKGISVKISPLKSLVESYYERLKIEPVSEFSSVVKIEVEDGTNKKAEDFLNQLVRKYNERAMLLKEELAESTAKFVGERLGIITEELTDVDKTAETFKTRNKISDAGSSAGLNMQAGKEIENQIVQTSTQLETTKAIKDFVSSKNTNDLLPVNIGINDNNVSSSMAKYNQLMQEKKRLLKTSTDKNPTVVLLNEQISDIKKNITSGLESLEATQKISLDALNRQGAVINSRLYAAPSKERQYRDIQREQGIKEQLYLYLLQKREESALTLGVVDPNAKIIDYAESLPNKVAPKKAISYILALFFGLIIPFIIIYLSNLLDSKIHTKDDVSDVLNIPIIGDIPKLANNQGRYLIKKEDYSPVAEAFRILRTNLNFIIPSETTNSNKGKVVFITSTIANEGKSLVSTNLSTSLAHANKKTLIIGMDIRAPKIKSYTGIRGDIGVTNFVVNSKLTPEDIINEVPNEDNLSIISSGDLAPNPAELLMSNRIKELFDYAKENYEYIIVDTAAYSMVTDTLLISKYADAFIYTIRANFLDKRMLSYIKQLYSEKRLKNMVLLVNGVDHKKSYGYGYGYGYGTAFENTKKPWWKFS